MSRIAIHRRFRHGKARPRFPGGRFGRPSFKGVLFRGHWLFGLYLFFLGPGAVAVEPSLSRATISVPLAAELVERVRVAYEALQEARLEGVIEAQVIGPARAEKRKSWQYRLAVDPGGDFLFVLRQRERELAFYRRRGQGFRYDTRVGSEEPTATLAGELLASLGPGGQDALLLPALLLPVASALPEAEAAAVEGPEPCGEDRCWILTLSQAGGTLVSTLWVREQTSFLYRVEVVVEEPAGFGGEALQRRFQVTAETPWTVPSNLTPPVVSAVPQSWLPYQPPNSLSKTEDSQTEDSKAENSKDRASRQGIFQDAIDVALRTVRVRALEADGSPIPGLEAKDFEARIGRKEVAVVAVDWVPAGQSTASTLPPEVLAEEGIVVDPPGQLVVFFVQAGLVSSRTLGHLKQVPRARQLLDTLGRDDRVAVVSFDSHLKLRLDFTRDFHRVEEALGDAILFSKGPILSPGHFPSLARHFDAADARRVATVEKALGFTAKSLKALPGEKVLVFVGWGLGKYTDGGVRFGLDYERARGALRQSRTTVFVLDISEADYHTLEIGLQQIARDTGGTYERVFRRGQIATKRLAQTLQGSYVVTVENPPPKKDKPVRLRLKGHRGELIVVEGGP